MSCPWVNFKAPEPVNFLDIVSEEVAKDLQAKADGAYHLQKISDESLNEVPPEMLDDSSATSDEVIARMLQMQFDKEYDQDLKRSEKKINGSSKVSVSFDNYRRSPKNLDFDSDLEEEVEDIADRKDWDRFDTLKREFASIPACGYKLQNGNMVTKHDVVMNGRKNVCKMLSFPPNFHTGDGEDFDMKISNKVFNSLKIHSQHADAKRYKLKDKKEDRATAEFGIDEYTRLLIYKMINQELLESVHGIISTGKEAVILHADCNTSYNQTELPEESVIKVFKTTLSQFKQRDKYIRDDYRFKERIGKQNSRKTVHLWAEKEMHNLNRLKRVGIPCPKVIILKNHVLVMSFIGSHHKPALKLKYAELNSADYFVAYEQIINAMKKMYIEANLIHADLSEYNILWHDNTCYFIDVSQSVEPVHENAFYFLMRDCNNIINFFAKKNIPKIQSAAELFKFITGSEFDEKIPQLRPKKNKVKAHTIDSQDGHVENFEKLWQEAKVERVLSENVELSDVPVIN